MEGARATWTDERLDDLAHRVDSGFARVDEDLRALGARLDKQGAELGARIDAQGAALGTRIDALQRTMIQVGLGMILTMVIGFAGLIATHAG